MEKDSDGPFFLYPESCGRSGKKQLRQVGQKQLDFIGFRVVV